MAEASDKVKEITLVKLEDITRNRDNPRRSFGRDALAELAASIGEMGLLQPLVVYKDDDKYTLLCGERRYRACKSIAKSPVPCVVVDKPATQEEELEIALTENIQRENLKVSEEARAIANVVERGMAITDVAKSLGRSPDYVSKRYYLGKHRDVLNGYKKSDEKHVEIYSEIGRVDNQGVRERLLEELPRRKESTYGPFRAKEFLETVRECARISAFGASDLLEKRYLTAFEQEYEGESVPPCEGEKGKCEHLACVGWDVARILDLGGGSSRALCVSKDESCLVYKKGMRVKVVESIREMDKTRPVTVGIRDDMNMAGERYGGKDCGECEHFKRVPDSIFFGNEIEGLDHKAYCLSEDGECHKSKRLAYDTRPDRGYEDRYAHLKHMEHEELKTLFVERFLEGFPKMDWEYERKQEMGRALLELESRGFGVEATVEVSQEIFKRDGNGLLLTDSGVDEAQETMKFEVKDEEAA